MPSLLDQTPRSRRTDIFGRALSAQHKADMDAEEEDRQIANDAIKQRNADRKARLEERRVQLDERQEDARIQAAELDLDREARVLKQFSTVAKELGKLNPKADDYDARIGQLFADNPDIFADTKTAFPTILRENMSALQKQRDIFMEGRQKEDNYALEMEAKHGFKVPRDENGRPKLAEATALVNTIKSDYATQLGMTPSAVEVGNGVTMKAVDPLTTPSDERKFSATQLNDWMQIRKSATDEDVKKLADKNIGIYQKEVDSFTGQLRGKPAATASTTTAPTAIDPKRLEELARIKATYGAPTK